MRAANANWWLIIIAAPTASVQNIRCRAIIGNNATNSSWVPSYPQLITRLTPLLTPKSDAEVRFGLSVKRLARSCGSVCWLQSSCWELWSLRSSTRARCRQDGHHRPHSSWLRALARCCSPAPDVRSLTPWTGRLNITTLPRSTSTASWRDSAHRTSSTSPKSVR